MGMLSEMHVLLSELETEELYRELLAYFGLVGALDACQALEAAWKDPYNRHDDIRYTQQGDIGCPKI